MLSREAALTYAALAFLAGLITGLASCTPNDPYPASPPAAATVQIR